MGKNAPEKNDEGGSAIMAETLIEVADGKLLTPDQYRASLPERLAEAQFTTIEELYEEVYEFIYDHVDLIDEAYYHVLTAWTIATWRIDHLQEIGYLLFQGVKGSGKTRAMEALQALCYNSEDASLISKPAIYRLLNQANHTFFLDEFDQYSMEKREALIGVLNSGYTKNKKAVLCDPHDRNLVKRYPTFGPKAIGTIKGVKGPFLSRCIPIPMIRNIRNINFRVEEQRGAIIKEKLKQYRAETYDDTIEDTFPIFQENEVTNYRLIQVLNSLIAVTPPAKRRHIIQFAKDEQREIDAERDTNIYVDLYNAIEIQNKDTPGLLHVSKIAELYNSNKPEEEQITPRKTGGLLTTMGLTRRKRTNIGTARIVNPRLLKRLAKRWKRTPITLEEYKR